jgi:hypothetical protein
MPIWLTSAKRNTTTAPAPPCMTSTPRLVVAQVMELQHIAHAYGLPVRRPQGCGGDEQIGKEMATCTSLIPPSTLAPFHNRPRRPTEPRIYILISQGKDAGGRSETA